MEQQICQALRDELRQFASTLLREELGEACKQLRLSLCKEFQNMKICPKYGEAQESGTHVLRKSEGLDGVESRISPASSLSYGDQQDENGLHANEQVVRKCSSNFSSESSSSVGRQLSTGRSSNGNKVRIIGRDNQDVEPSAFRPVASQSMADFCKQASQDIMRRRISVLDERPHASDLEEVAKREMGDSQITWTSESKFVEQALKITATRQNMARAFINFCILLNGLFIGVQTDRQARLLTDDIGILYSIVEVMFCVIFTTELVINLYVYRSGFYFTPNGCEMWNVFDTFLVVVQLTDIFSSLAQDSISTMVNLSFVRMIRIFRLLRVLRLLRLLRFVPELALIVTSIMYSAQSLCWVMLLLLIMMYMVGIMFCQIVFVHRVELDEDSEDLKLWWGSLGLSVLSLYEAILGGVDWDTVLRPLMEEISPAIALAFCFYIAFALLAVMNIITGTFVTSSIRDADREKSKDFMEQARLSLVVEGQAFASHDHFLEIMCDQKFAKLLKHMNIQPEQAMVLFSILEKETGGRVDPDRLVESLVRMGDSAKFMDIMKLMYEHSRILDWAASMEKGFDHIDKRFDQLGHNIAKDVLTHTRKGSSAEFGNEILTHIRELFSAQFGCKMQDPPTTMLAV